MKKLLTALTTGCLMACSSQNVGTFKLSADTQPLMDDDLEAVVDDLYNRMTSEERLAQLYGMFMEDLFVDGKLDTAKCRQLIPNGAGHFSQYAFNTNMMPDGVRDRVKVLQEWIKDNTPNGVPALFHEEGITGVNSLGETIYPQQIGLACSFNTELAEKKARQTSTQMRRLGGYLALSPMVDVCRQPTFNRLEESYGEDGYLSAAMGVAFVRGLQSMDKLASPSWQSIGVAACSKHYLGYGGGGDAPEKELMEEILFPHEAMIRTAASKVVMPGYHLFHGTKCIANKELLTGILRQYVGFDGLVVSDYTAMSQIRNGQSPMQNAAQSINAGADVEFPNDVNFSHLPEAIDSGLVDSATVAIAVKRVLALKARLGMLDDRSTSGRLQDKNVKLYEEGHIVSDTPEERQTAHDLATQSIVLLKNDDVLPLDGRRNKKIALLGPNANSVWAMLGDYTYPCMSYFWRDVAYKQENVHIVTLKEGLEKVLPEGMTMTYERGCDWTEGIETKIEMGGDERARYMASRRIDAGESVDPERALKLAAESDIVIAAMGEQVLLDGENRERDNVRLPGRQEEFVRQLIATGKPVVLVMFGGRCQVIGDLADKCAAIIQAWYPGEEGGNAVAEILTGKVNPSAKLSVGYPDVEIKESICYVYSEQQDARIKYPFGYGLSYTTFEYSDMKVDKQVSTSDEVIHLSFKIKNTGKMAGDEIAQLYVSPNDDSSLLRPIKLQGFSRVSLLPGEEKTMSFILSPQQLGYYGDHQWNITPGQFTIKVGASSQDIRLQESVTLSGEKQSMPLRTVYFAERVD